MATLSLSFYSNCLERTVPLRALVPVDNATSPDPPERPLPALYLLHGLYGSENDWFQNTRVIPWARQLGLAVFCPAGENSFYVNRAAGDGAYLRFLGEELPAFTRRLFPLSRRREDTFIAGLSMGGYGALNAAFTYPETFGKAAALSAALRPWLRMRQPAGGMVQCPAYAAALFGANASDWDTLTLARRCGERAPALWLACGAQDTLLGENLAFVEGLEAAGIPARFDQPPGAHSWDFWDREIFRVLQWLREDA